MTRPGPPHPVAPTTPHRGVPSWDVFSVSRDFGTKPATIFRPRRRLSTYTTRVFRLVVVVVGGGDTRPRRDRRPCVRGVKIVAPAPYGRWVGFPRPTGHDRPTDRPRVCASRRRFSHVAAMVSTAPVPVTKPNRVRNGRANETVYCSFLFIYLIFFFLNLPPPSFIFCHQTPHFPSVLRGGQPRQTNAIITEHH